MRGTKGQAARRFVRAAALVAATLAAFPVCAEGERAPTQWLVEERVTASPGATATPDVFVGLPEDETPPPDVLPDGSVMLLGVKVAPDQETLDLGDTKVTDVPELAAALDLLPALRRVDMFESRLSDDDMARLYARYPHIRFGWTVKVASYTIRTDDTVFSMHDRDPARVFYKSDAFRNLTYCHDMLAIDLGHNQITEISFLRNMPHLKILILADNRIADISPLANMPELEYVELFKNKLIDLSPLIGCENILDLNLCLNYIADVTPLMNLPKLERLWISRNKLPLGTAKSLRERYPGCQMNFTVHFSTDGGWRKHDRFYIMRYVLNQKDYRPFSDGLPEGLDKSKYK